MRNHYPAPGISAGLRRIVVICVIAAFVAVLVSLVGCSSPTEPQSEPPDTLRPEFEQVYQGGGGGAGGGGSHLVDSKGRACTLHGTNNSQECSMILIRVMTGGLAGFACKSWNCLVGVYGYTTGQLVDWKNHPDPWFEPWFNPGTPGSQGLWPPGVGGTYPMPIGGF